MSRAHTAWCGDLISIIGATDFGHRFHTLMDEVIGVDQCTVFVFGGGRPEAVVAEARSNGTKEVVRHLSGLYVENGFRSDPIRARIQDAIGGASEVIVRRTFELSDKSFRHQFYEKPNIRQELALVAKLDETRIYASFYRETNSREYTAEDVEKLQLFASPALQTLRKHSEITGLLQADQTVPDTTPVSRLTLLAEVRDALRREQAGLTPREAEVCAGIVLGYTVLGMSLNMRISVNTVATHRKRAYTKLRISSQNELFARYFDTVHRIQSKLHQRPGIPARSLS
jgi:DNA-binding CsgD family transcriptional regulator